jgi:putative transposase
MPRAPRIDVAGLPQHLIVRGNDRADIFFGSGDRSYFLDCIGQASRTRECDVHAFVLMDNHVHLLATSQVSGAVSRLMQDVGRRYVKRVNKKYGRTGTRFEGRFKSSIVQTDAYFLACMRYIEMNPVRAAMVAHPEQFRWSSHRSNASGAPAGLLTPHAEYLALGNQPLERAAAYRRLFDEAIESKQIEAIRESARHSRALGDAAFYRALEATLGRSVRPVPQGRPEASRCSVPFSRRKGI